ncbi:MAG TPA: hypothetical protein VGG48_03115 [Rhizomicrobium sp.]|jgi:tetratricopeptide (TPR) repeat protein
MATTTVATMGSNKKALWLAAALIVSLPATALANAADDGNQGLAALQQGDNDTAIRLFTHALNSGLSGDDREFAYANRGKAYLQKGDASQAIADLDRARQMKPDDIDAQNDLLKALAVQIPPDSIPGRPKQSGIALFGAALLGAFLGDLSQAIQQ